MSPPAQSNFTKREVFRDQHYITLVEEQQQQVNQNNKIISWISTTMLIQEHPSWQTTVILFHDPALLSQIILLTFYLPNFLHPSQLNLI